MGWASCLRGLHDAERNAGGFGEAGATGVGGKRLVVTTTATGSQGLLPLGNFDDRLSAGPSDDRRPRVLSKGNPHHARGNGPTQDERLPKQSARAGSPRHQREDPMYAGLQV
jgi:hypothetical protein